MAKKTSRLGKGLNALITNRNTPPATKETPQTPSSPPADNPDPPSSIIREIALDAIEPNPHQPRSTFDEQALKELAASIRENGVVQPIVVRRKTDNEYQLVAGERRWRAAGLAELDTIPAIVRELSDEQSFAIALIENLQREDLGPLERAAAYQHYLDSFGGTIEDLAKQLSESRANISNYLRLLKLRPEICYMLGAGELGMGQARAIAGVEDPERQLALARLAARRNLSVRQVEELVRNATDARTSAEEPDIKKAGQQHHLTDVERALSKSLGLRVRLYPGRRKNSGRIVISYGSLDEFDQLAERLGGKSYLE